MKMYDDTDFDRLKTLDFTLRRARFRGRRESEKLSLFQLQSMRMLEKLKEEFRKIKSNIQGMTSLNVEGGDVEEVTVDGDTFELSGTKRLAEKASLLRHRVHILERDYG